MDAGESMLDGGSSVQDAGSEPLGTDKLRPGCGCEGTGAAPWLVALAAWALRSTRWQD